MASDEDARGTQPMAAVPPDAVVADAQAQLGSPLVELNALLGHGTHYAGKLHFEGRVRIEGRFEGEIRGEDVLVIGEGAEIDGDIEVGVCIVTGGEVRANIRARNAIELHAPAFVRGDLHAPNVFIDRGVTFEGNCKMAPLDDDGATEAAMLDMAERATSPHDDAPRAALPRPAIPRRRVPAQSDADLPAFDQVAVPPPKETQPGLQPPVDEPTMPFAPSPIDQIDHEDR